MHEVKIANFQKEHPGREFPPYRALRAEEAIHVRMRIAALVGVPPDSDPLSLTERLAGAMSEWTEHNAEDKGFELRAVCESLRVQPLQHVYINWGRFDDVNSMEYRDLVDYFDFIWYPGPDEIEVFDSTFAWVVSVDHDGHIRFLKARADSSVDR